MKGRRPGILLEDVRSRILLENGDGVRNLE
jgi:hypothetical protein